MACTSNAVPTDKAGTTGKSRARTARLSKESAAARRSVASDGDDRYARPAEEDEEAERDVVGDVRRALPVVEEAGDDAVGGRAAGCLLYTSDAADE